MQFVITAYDYKDIEAIDRRLEARESHLAGVRALFEAGKYLMAAALLDDEQKMIGSIILAEFDTREILDQCIQVDPYVVGRVWELIEVKPCKIGSVFLKG